MIRAYYPRTYRTLSIHLLRLLKELASILMMSNTCDIKDDDGCTWIFDIGGNEWMEALLSCGIPELHSEAFILDIDGFGYKIYSNSRLGLRKGVLVNFLWSYRRWSDWWWRFYRLIDLRVGRFYIWWQDCFTYIFQIYVFYCYINFKY